MGTKVSLPGSLATPPISYEYGPSSAYLGDRLGRRLDWARSWVSVPSWPAMNA